MATDIITAVTDETGFPKRLRLAREQMGFGVNELDGMVGSNSVGQTSRLELGIRAAPSIATVAKYAEALGVSLDWLWLGKGPARPRRAAIDVGATAFFEKLESKGLRPVLAATPDRWKLSTIARAVQLEFLDEPDGGWSAILDAIEAGKYEVRYGNGAAVERANQAQVGRRARKRRR